DDRHGRGRGLAADRRGGGDDRAGRDRDRNRRSGAAYGRQRRRRRVTSRPDQIRGTSHRTAGGRAARRRAADRDRYPTSPPTAAAAPLARRGALTHGVELAELGAPGPGGRITRGDVLAAAGIAPPQPWQSAQAPRAEADVERLTRVQQVIARRMTESKATIPEFEVQTE